MQQGSSQDEASLTIENQGKDKLTDNMNDGGLKNEKFSSNNRNYDQTFKLCWLKAKLVYI